MIGSLIILLLNYTNINLLYCFAVLAVALITCGIFQMYYLVEATSFHDIEWNAEKFAPISYYSLTISGFLGEVIGVLVFTAIVLIINFLHFSIINNYMYSLGILLSFRILWRLSFEVVKRDIWHYRFSS